MPEKTTAEIRVETILMANAAEVYLGAPEPEVRCSDCGYLIPGADATITEGFGTPYVQCPDKGAC